MCHSLRKPAIAVLALLLVASICCPLALGHWQRPASAATAVSPDGWGVVHNRSADQTMYAIWGTSPSDIFAVGGPGVIVHYDGHAWSTMNSGDDGLLFDVWGSSGSDVWAVGDAGTILHYDGKAWTDWSLPGPDAPDIWGVWGSSSQDVFFVGTAGNILRYTGGSTWDWRTEGTADLHAVWGVSSSDVFAVGSSGTVLHYDGNSDGIWRTSDTGTSATFWGVWGPSSKEIFIVGNAGIIHATENGWSTWSGASGVSAAAVWGNSASDVYAVGDYGRILHYDGNSGDVWADIDSGVPQHDLRGVWGYPPGGDVYVVGWQEPSDAGVILHYPSPTLSQVSPDRGSPGQTLAVTLKGAHLGGVDHVSDLSFGAGITVNSLSQKTATAIEASITISPTAALGARSVSVSDSGDKYSLASAFEVAAPAADAVPPAGISDLAGTAVTSTAVALTWTAPGDDGSAGAASSYDIRYSTEEMTEASWGSATQCSGEPAPGAAGAAQTFTVTDLQPQTAYHFAVKAADEVPNWSGLSNVAIAETEPAKPENRPPEAPAGTSPVDGSAGASLTPTLQASAFSDPDPLDPHAASQWQIDDQPWDFQGPAFDSGTDNTNLSAISVPSGRLAWSGLYYWRVRHQDNRGAWSDWSAERSFTTISPPSDSTPPTTPTVADDGASTGSTDSIQATWSSFDPESPIVEYQYAVGTSPGGDNVAGWTSAGAAMGTTATRLSLESGQTYYLSVRARNSLGLWSEVGSSNGITVSAGDAQPAQEDRGGVPFWVWIAAALAAAGVAAGGFALGRRWRSGRA